MSWNYLPELEGVFSEKTFSVLERSEQLKSCPTADAFCCSGRKMTAVRCSRSGMTSEPSASAILTAGNILNGSVPSRTSSASAEDFLARILARAAKVRESPARNQVCGSKWRALSEKFNLHTSSRKTVRCSPAADSKSSWLHWPKWGMMQNGACWELDTSDTPLKENAFGYWGGITCTMAKDMTPNRDPQRILQSKYGAVKNSVLYRMLTATGCWPTVSLLERLMGWPIGWTALKPLAMDKFRQWQQLHGKF